MVKPPLRTKSIGFKVSEEEYARLETAAQASGRTLGEWCREVTLRDTSSTSPGQLPADYMSNRQPGAVDAGILFGHEFGHVRYEWGGFWRHALDSSNRSAVRLENDVRKVRDPSAPTRTQH